jgi:hypothetical protein
VGVAQKADAVVLKSGPVRHEAILAGIEPAVAPLLEPECDSDGYSATLRRAIRPNRCSLSISPCSGIPR